jgi:hypothetical protein
VAPFRDWIFVFPDDPRISRLSRSLLQRARVPPVGCGGSRPGELFEFGDDRPQNMAVKRAAVHGLGMQHKLAALGLGHRGGDRYFAAELVGPSGAGSRP